MKPVPISIKRTEEGIRITWRDGHAATYSYGHLRRNCPCAGCRNTTPHVVEADDPFRLFDDDPIRAEGASLVGSYAVQFQWNDGHSHGIYSFEYLRTLCPCPECVAVQATED